MTDHVDPCTTPWLARRTAPADEREERAYAALEVLPAVESHPESGDTACAEGDADASDVEPPPPPGWPADWQDEIKADLARQVEAGATLYGYRPDGQYVARSKHGDRVIEGGPGTDTDERSSS